MFISMNRIKQLKYLVILIIYLTNIPIVGQDNALNKQDIIVPSSSLIKSTGEVLQKHTPLYNLAIGRFMPVFLSNGFGSWTSQRMLYTFNGTSNDNIPFGFNSIDFIPVDILNINSIKIKTRPTIFHGLPAPDGVVDLGMKPISDTLKISGRIYTGSETGDALIYNFTRKDFIATNKNKFVPSGMFSIENTTSSLSYRFTGGYLGYYNTGSINDPYINVFSPYYVNKQNKQFKTSLLLNYKLNNLQSIELETSFLSYYGWDVIPFITTLTHSEFYLYNAHLSYNNILPGFSLKYSKKFNLNEINKVEFQPGSKFITDQNTFTLLWKAYSAGSYYLDLMSDINLLNVSDNNDASGTDVFRIFKNDFQKLFYGIALNTMKTFGEHANINFNLRGDRYYTKKFVTSGDIELYYSFNKHNNLELSVSSIAKNPNVYEHFGSILTFRNDYASLPDSFSINGNENLIEERNNYLGIKYNLHNYNIISDLTAECFAYITENPIEQLTLRKTQSTLPGDFVRDAVYKNAGKRKASGFNFSCSASQPFLDLSFYYRFLNNKDVPYSPKHFVKSILKFPVLRKTEFEVNYYFRSKTIWEEFTPQDADDIVTLKDVSNLDLSIEHYLRPFYFFEEVSFKIAVENIFDNQWQYLPIGNKIGRTVMVYLSLSK